MAFYYNDAPALTDETFAEAIAASDKPAVVLFWDDTVEVDNMVSLAMGLRWLHDGSECRNYYNFFKVNKSEAPEVWKQHGVTEAEMREMADGGERWVGFHNASEICKTLSVKHKKALKAAKE